MRMEISGLPLTDGSIWRVAFSESDGSLGTASSAKITPTATNSTATPVIYNGRVYVGCTDTDASAVYRERSPCWMPPLSR